MFVCYQKKKKAITQKRCDRQIDTVYIKKEIWKIIKNSQNYTLYVTDLSSCLNEIHGEIERMLHPEIKEKAQLLEEVAEEFPFLVVRYHQPSNCFE